MLKLTNVKNKLMINVWAVKQDLQLMSLNAIKINNIVSLNYLDILAKFAHQRLLQTMEYVIWRNLTVYCNLKMIVNNVHKNML